MATLKAAVVQLSISDIGRFSWPEVEKKLIFLFSQGIEAGADLVIFPALTGLLFSPESRKTLEYGFDQRTVQLVSRLGGFWTGEWLDFFGSLAKNYRVLVVPGSTLEASENGMHHRTLLLDSKGEQIINQHQIHFTPEELELGFLPGEALELTGKTGPRIGLLLSHDTWVPEVGRIFALQGAEVLISLQAVSSFYDYRRQLAGAWECAQANQCIVLESCLVGKGAQWSFQGLSAIFAPSGLHSPIGVLSHIDPYITGFSELDMGYLISPQKEREGVLIRNLNLDSLSQYRRETKFRQGLNHPVFVRELSDLYGQKIVLAPEDEEVVEG